MQKRKQKTGEYLDCDGVWAQLLSSFHAPTTECFRQEIDAMEFLHNYDFGSLVCECISIHMC